MHACVHACAHLWQNSRLPTSSKAAEDATALSSQKEAAWSLRPITSAGFSNLKGRERKNRPAGTLQHVSLLSVGNLGDSTPIPLKHRDPECIMEGPPSPRVESLNLVWSKIASPHKKTLQAFSTNPGLKVLFFTSQAVKDGCKGEKRRSRAASQATPTWGSTNHSSAIHNVYSAQEYLTWSEYKCPLTHTGTHGLWFSPPITRGKIRLFAQKYNVSWVSLWSTRRATSGIHHQGYVVQKTTMRGLAKLYNLHRNGKCKAEQVTSPFPVLFCPQTTC